MNEIKVICCDIDGTLVRDDKSLSDENKLWIEKAIQEKGVRFVIVTGRIPSAVDRYSKVLSLKEVMSCTNGTYLIDQDKKPLISHTFPREIARIVVSVKEELNASMLTVCGNSWYTEDHQSYVYKKKRALYDQESIVCDDQKVIEAEAVNKFLFLDPNPKIIQKVQDSIRSRLKNPNVVSLYSGCDFLEVMPGGVNKGTSVIDIMKHFNADPCQVMAIGDDINDIEMLRNAGLGVAMGNAFDCVKEAADYVTDTNENDGVAKAIQKFVFKL